MLDVQSLAILEHAIVTTFAYTADNLIRAEHTGRPFKKIRPTPNAASRWYALDRQTWHRADQRLLVYSLIYSMIDRALNQEAYATFDVA